MERCSIKLLSFAFLLFFTPLFSQNSEKCGFDSWLNRQKQNPNYLKQLQLHEENNRKSIHLPKPKTTFKIPVVVHVLHLGEALGVGTNISDAQIQSAIDNLNDVYANKFGNSVDLGVQFELAKRDPNCNTTTGINRINATAVPGYTQYGVKLDGTVGAVENDLKDLSKWPTDQYMNFWIVSEIDNNNGVCGTLGYANLPVAIDQYNGAVMMASVFGYDPTNTKGYYLGACGGDNSTVTHEVGHFLDLYHTFEGDGTGSSCPTESSCSTQNDFVCDTPIHKRNIGTCNTGNNTCVSGGSLVPVIYNIMNYTNCPDRFTAGQVARVTNCLQTTRASLVNSLGLTPPSGSFFAPKSACTSITSGPGLSAPYAGITKVELSNMTKISSSTDVDNPTNGYMDFSALCINAIQVQTGQTYPLKVELYGDPSNSYKIIGWIDYNNNGTFENTELVIPQQTASSAALVNVNVTIPNTATLNTTLRMRIIADLVSNISSSCFTTQYGQTEDYAVIISSNSVLNGDFSASKLVACVNDQIDFTETTTSGTATGYAWSFTPSAGVTYVGGTNANSQNPKVQFANGGSYAVQLVISDALTSKTISKSAYITVNANPTISGQLATCSSTQLTGSGTANSSSPWTSTSTSVATINNSGLVNAVSAGNTTITYKDNNGCIATATVTIQSSFTISEQITPSTCGSNGVVTYSLSGGQSPFSLTFNNVSNSSLTVSNLAAGSYNYSIVDQNGCTKSGSTTITSSGGPSVVISGTNTTCGNSNGSALLTITNNNSQPNINWSNNATSASISNLAAGLYTATVVVDGCTFSNLSYTVGTSVLPTLVLNVTNETCGQSNGSISTNLTGNVAQPIFTWSNNTSNSSISGLVAGTYSVSVQVDGCTLTDSKVITNNSSNASLSLSKIDPTCGLNNGSVTAIVLNNSGTPTYLWASGETTNVINNLGAGSYSVTVTVDGCTLNASSILVASTSVPTLQINSIDASCGLNNGQLNAIVSGNQGTPNYSWSNSAITSSLTNLAAGNYSLTVTVDGCSLTGSKVITTIAKPQLSLSGQNPTCVGNDGKITALVSGNLAIPSWSWNNGVNTSVNSNLSSGKYVLTVAVDGCTLMDSVSLVSTATLVQHAISGTDPICGGSTGTVSSNVTGNTGAISYLWSNGATTQAISNVLPGKYSVLIHVDGCSFTDTLTLKDLSSDAGLLSSNQWVCNDANVSLSLSGYTGVIQNWYTSTDGKNYTSVNNTTSSLQFKMNDPKKYFYVIVKNGNCSADTSSIVIVNQYSSPIVDLPISEQVLANSVIYLTPTVSNGTYLWSPSNLAMNPSSSNSDIKVPQSSAYVKLTVTDPNGCSSSDSTLLYVVDHVIHDLKIPTGFSPNNDGKNDLFEVFNIIGLEKFEIKIFDRWGNVVYASEDPSAKWNGYINGEQAVPGTYTFEVMYKFLNTDIKHQSGYLELLY